jgi:hypothetical protein
MPIAEQVSLLASHVLRLTEAKELALMEINLQTRELHGSR